MDLILDGLFRVGLIAMVELFVLGLSVIGNYNMDRETLDVVGGLGAVAAILAAVVSLRFRRQTMSLTKEEFDALTDKKRMRKADVYLVTN